MRKADGYYRLREDATRPPVLWCVCCLVAALFVPSSTTAQELAYVLAWSGPPIMQSRCSAHPGGICAGTLFIIDLQTGEVIGSETAGHGVYPGLTRSAGGNLLAWNRWGGGVAVRDRVTQADFEFIPRSSSTSFSYGPTLSAAGDTFYRPRTGGIDVISRNGQSLIEMPDGGPMAVSPDQSTAYVNLPAGIAFIDLGSRSVTSTLTLESAGVGNVALSPDGSRLFAIRIAGTSNDPAVTLVAIDIVARTVVATAAVPHHGELLVSAGGAKLWMTDGTLDRPVSNALVRVLRTDTLQETNVLTIAGATGLTLTRDGSRVVVTTQTALHIVDASTDSLLQTIPLPFAPYRPAVILPAAAPCQFRVSPADVQAPARGGNFFLSVPAQTGCNWRIENAASWIRNLPPGASGPSTVTFELRDNALGDLRSTRLSIASQWVTVSQAAHPNLQGAPLAPSNLTATLDAGGFLTLNWSPPVMGPSPTHFIVEAGTAAGDRDSLSHPVGPVLSVSGGPLRLGTTYIRVRAANAVGAGPPSNEVAVSPYSRPPALASVNTGWIAPGVGAISWTEAVIASTSFRVEVGRMVFGPDLGIVNTTGSILTFPADALPPGHYYVRVSGINAAGVGPATPSIFPAVFRFGPCDSSPQSPVVSVVSVTTQAVSLQLSVLSGQPFNLFRLVVARSPGGADVATLDLTTTNVSGQLPSGRYYVRAHTVNSCGVSASSAEQTFVVP